MAVLPYEKLVSLIIEKSALTREEVEEKITQKVNSFSGLISQEGAAHVVANEEGVNIMDAIRAPMEIKDITSENKDVTLNARIVRVYEIREFSKNGTTGKVGSILVGDDTGVIRVTFWHDHTGLLSALTQGDIIQLQHLQARQNAQMQDRVELTYTGGSAMQKDPQGVSFSANPPSAAAPATLSTIDQVESGSVSLLANIVQLYPPSFYIVDPQTGRKATPTTVDPQVAYVLNAILDDGTGTIRAVCFREQALTILGLTHAVMVALKENPTLFEEQRKRILGEFVLVSGKVQYNEQYARKEILVQSIELDPQPPQ